MAVFVLLAAMQRDALAGFVDPNEGKAEFRLARISLGIQGNQRSSHQPGQTGADQRIGDGTPDHVPRDGDIIARHLERDLRRQGPQHPNEGDDLQQRIDHAAAEVGRVVAEQARILLNTLVRVVTVHPGEAQLIDPHRLEPLDQEVTGDPLAQSKLQALLEKGLRDRERQQNGNDDEKCPKMMDEPRQILAAHGVEELAVPLIEPHLAEHVANGDGDCDGEDRHHASPAFGPPQHTREQAQVAGKIEILQWRSCDAFVSERGSGRYDRYDGYHRLCGLRHPRPSLWRRVCGQRGKGRCNVRLHVDWTGQFQPK